MIAAVEFRLLSLVGKGVESCQCHVPVVKVLTDWLGRVGLGNRSTMIQ